MNAVSTASLPTPSGAAVLRRPTATAAAGITYVLSWIIGLAFAPAAPDHNAAAGTVHAFYTAHPSQVTGSALFVHGIAGIALAVLAVGIATLTGAGGGLRRVTVGTGLAAASLSVAQFALACIAAAGTSASTSRLLFQSIDFVDAVKLALLAAFAVVATKAARRAGAAPRWLRIAAAALVLLLLVGTAALVGFAAAMPMLELSLLVLLVWAAAISITVTRKARRRAHI